ncbi:MAG: hypothetical protein G01um101417_515 [Parcubacteria group bacterium Gr01-1014_17]|nr:MAG: hypothetical protein G01um101417_515 [Parcubacteria group bacterium Gr01-1014_17]
MYRLISALAQIVINLITTAQEETIIRTLVKEVIRVMGGR